MNVFSAPEPITAASSSHELEQMVAVVQPLCNRCADTRFDTGLRPVIYFNVVRMTCTVPKLRRPSHLLGNFQDEWTLGRLGRLGECGRCRLVIIGRLTSRCQRKKPRVILAAR